MSVRDCLDVFLNPKRSSRALSALFHPVLYPGVGELLSITQRQPGYLMGLSQQRVNVGLRAVQATQVIGIGCGGLRVLDLP